MTVLPLHRGRVVCFGEPMLRMAAPGRELLMQSRRLEVDFGGAEMNVAVSLARLGAKAAAFAVLPDNPMGGSFRDELRKHGVDVGGVRFAPGRMALYFLANGALTRPSEVFYDRAGSAFALSSWDDFDWKEGLAGADWLHLSGITPTLGSGPARAVLQAAAAAKTVGAKVSFDGNHRAKLWETAPLEAAQAVRRLYELADLLFADHRDIGLALGRDFTGEADPFAAAAEAAFEAFPALGRMACTRRTQHSVDHHDLTARLATRTGVHSARHYALPQVVDRIGAGDAFCAGFLFAEMTGRPDAECLDFALAAAALKHSLPGDFNLASERDVAAALCEGGFQVRR